MNFFDAQDHARKSTRALVAAYVVATLLIVAGVTAVAAAALYGGAGVSADPRLLTGVAGLTLLVIIGSTLFRMARLTAGGGQVAREMGGTLVSADETDPLRRRYRNVVEEMAIASGVPVPEIYVLENERAINAFAAGYSPDDAAIAVTRGTLEHLERDELQGVVAHEFSHILNGDMRLNIRLMGVLFGIMVIGLIGRTILRGGSGRSRRGKGSGGVVIVGLGLAILGYIGVFFARIIKAAVSRQREYLADASAVQFTRQTDGIANALKKIGGYAEHSYFKEKDAEQVSHMLFAVGARFSAMFATHPPLTERIQALDPAFDDSQYPEVRESSGSRSSEQDARVAGFSASAGTASVGPQDVVDAIGQPGPAQVAYASALHAAIPDELLAPARSPDQALLLVIALLLSGDEAVAGRQFQLLTQRLGDKRTAVLKRYYSDINALGPRFSLPLMEIAFPALRQLSAAQQEFLQDTTRELVELDGYIDLREFCLQRVLARSLDNAAAPNRSGRGRSAGKAATRNAASMLVYLIAYVGNKDPDARAEACRAGLSEFGNWAASQTFSNKDPDVVVEFSRALDVLQRLHGKAAETLIRAATRTAMHDQQITVAEAEMLRTVCACLGCPVPPVVTKAQTGA